MDLELKNYNLSAEIQNIKSSIRQNEGRNVLADEVSIQTLEVILRPRTYLMLR